MRNGDPPLKYNRTAMPMLCLVAACLTACAGANARGETSTSSARSATIAVTLVDGEVIGDGGRVEVELGSTVNIVLTSDVADEVHLHGYNISMPVSSGAETTLTFEATIPGVFEVELETLGERLLSLQVA